MVNTIMPTYQRHLSVSENRSHCRKNGSHELCGMLVENSTRGRLTRLLTREQSPIGQRYPLFHEFTQKENGAGDLLHLVNATYD